MKVQLLSLSSLAACLLVQTAAGALPPAAGVRAEPMGAGVRLNGVLLEIVHLSGKGLASLITQTQAAWEKGSGATAYTQTGDHSLLSHQTETESETLLWKTSEGSSSALYSRLDRRQLPASQSQFAWRLPAACHWQQTIETLGSDASLQGTAYCLASHRALISQLQRSLASAGWSFVGHSEQLPLVWRKTHWQLQLALTNARPEVTGAGATSVALFAVQSSVVSVP